MKSDKTSGSSESDQYKKYLHHNENTLKTALAQYLEYKAEYQELQKLLQTLPDQTHYDAMVPVGPLAFFPGQLIHTNEILVLLGENLFVERSAKQAAAIAGRREKYADEKIAELDNQLNKLVSDETRLMKRKEIEENMYNEDGEQIVDIKEEVVEGEMAFGEEPSVAPGDCVEESSELMRDKRERAVGSGNDVALDRNKLSAEERRFLETFERYADDSEDDEENERGEEVVDRGESEDDGDAFSDEDRANAARDDDEDDYNNSDNEDDDDDDDGDGDEESATRPTVVERVIESQPPSLPAAAPPKGILKQRPATSLFKRRMAEQKQTDDDDNSSSGPTRTVSFDASAKPSEEIGIEQVAERVDKLQIKDKKDAKKQSPMVFKPNVAAAVRPMKQAVVERDTFSSSSSSLVTESPTHESVDDDLHAKEIVQAYTRLRHKRMVTGKMDGAAEIAERVLSSIPGVTLVDRAGAPGASEDKSGEGFERIELAEDPSPFNMAHAAAHPPEVVHQEKQRPKMSRFKAKRLGLEE
ncbi:uri1, prefoldin-like chaperone [Coemansia asiatica]|nr:uri1, prefoldin-like chaperone [Coemansia asiatica]